MKTLSIEVRPATAQDVPDIAEVHRQSWLQAYTGLIPHRALLQMVERRGEAWWRRAVGGPSTLLVLDVAGMVAGYTTVGLSRARSLPQEGEIYELYLRPEYQGIGMGRILFGEARLLLKSLGCDGILAWCLEDSDHANRFFRRSGGQDIAEGVEDFDGQPFKKIGFAWS